MSRETVARMVLGSRAFLEKPSMHYFKSVRGKARPALQKRAYVIAFEHEVLSEDTLWGELKRSARQIAKHVREEGFTLARVDAVSDKVGSSAIILLPVVDALPDVEERVRPGVEMAEGAKSFADKNRGAAELVWVGEDGRCDCLRSGGSRPSLLSSTRCSKSRLDRVGVSKEVARALKKNGRVLRGRGSGPRQPRGPGSRKGWSKSFRTRLGSEKALRLVDPRRFDRAFEARSCSAPRQFPRR